MMATADACKRASFTYIWAIENMPKLTSMSLRSPKFVAHSVSKAAWYVKVEIKPSHAYFICGLCSDDLGEEESEIDIEFSLLALDGSPIISEGNVKVYLFINMLRSQTASVKWEDFLPNNTSTVQCRMWRKGREILTTDFCYARTRLKTNTGSFLWPIEEFSALKSSTEGDFRKLALDERKVCSWKPLTKKGPFIALILYLKRISDFDYVHIYFLVEKGRDYAFGCELSVLDAKREVTASQVQTCGNAFSWKFIEFDYLISKHKLISGKDLFLRNDTLLVKCSFEIYIGVISSEIEYYTPNVSLVIKDEVDVSDKEMDSFGKLKFEEYFIKKAEVNYFVDNYVEEKSDSDSCRDSCKLKAALRHLHSKAILSDVSLHSGTKLYPVHKNLLCSRSPVFEIIFSKDMKNNIFEINDMDENTLCRLLQYIYTDTVGDLQFQNALDLFKAAADYQLLDLKDKCSEFLVVKISKTNLCDILSLGNKYQDEKLEMAIREFYTDFYK